MRPGFRGLFAVAVLTTSLSALGANEEPPPPPPPPPPAEETGPVDAPPSTSSGGDWDVKAQEGLLDKSTGHSRKMMISAFFGIPWGTGYGGGYVGGFNIGFGGRFYIPIVKEGFLPMLNDSFGIEAGLDPILVLGGGFGFGAAFALAIPVEARWNFHIFKNLEAYAKLGAGVGLFFFNGVHPYFVGVANVGALYKLTDTFYARVEFGSPAVKLGIGLAF